MADPAIAGRIMAESKVQDAVLRLLGEIAVSARANAPHADRIDPEWAATIGAKKARLEQMRDGLEKSIGTAREKIKESLDG